MTGKTHCAGGVTAVTLLAVSGPAPTLDPTTLAACGIALLAGALAPDLDKPGSTLWRKVPAGGILAWLARPVFVGGHRHLSHSLLGMALFGAGVRALLLLAPAGTFRTSQVLSCFLAAYASHLVLDSLTEGGVPWLFPIARRFGFPPFRTWRIKTNGWFENLVVHPLLWLATIALAGSHAAVLLGR